MTNDTDSNHEASADDGSEKQKNVADKLKTMGVMSSDKEDQPVKESKSPYMLISIVAGLVAVGVVAYMYTSGELDNLVASISSGDEEVSTSNHPGNANSEFIPAAGMNQNQPYVQTGHNGNVQQNDWAEQQRADFEKRRAEYDKRMAATYANDRSSPEAPQWVKDRQAEMDKYYKEMEKFRKDMAEQQKQWVNQQSTMQYNAMSQVPGHMRHPQMNNGYANIQPQAGIAQANRQNLNRAPVQYYYPPRPYYYNQAPYNGYTNGPHPYGWRGYR